MQQKVVGDAAQGPVRLLVIDALRFVGQISTGQHDGPVDPLQHQMVQGRVRQHDAERADTQCNILGNKPTPAITRRDDDNRCGGAAQDGRLPFGDAEEGPSDIQIAHHHGERLACAPLAFPQACYGCRVGRVAGELKSPEALDRKDVSTHQQRCRSVDVVG